MWGVTGQTPNPSEKLAETVEKKNNNNKKQ